MNELFGESSIVKNNKLHIFISYEQLNTLIPWLNLSTRFNNNEIKELILNFLPGNLIVVNDIKVTDEVLKEVAVRIRKGIRDIDLPCRYGREEFCALLPETDLNGAEILAERLREAARPEHRFEQLTPDDDATV